MDRFTRLPQEVLKLIIDNLEIKDAVNLSQTCKSMNTLIENRDFWRHRLLLDFRCVSLCADGDSEGRRAVHKETYKLLYWSESSDEYGVPEGSKPPVAVHW